MKRTIYWMLFAVLFSLSPLACLAAPDEVEVQSEVAAQQEKVQKTSDMLVALLELKKSLKEEIVLSKRKQRESKSDAEKTAIDEEIARLDKQFSEATTDFKRLAVGVELSLFEEKKPVTFSWQEEVGRLLEPAIKELQRFTVKARKKTELKESIDRLIILTQTADQAVDNLSKLEQKTENTLVKKEVKALKPEWLNVQKRLKNKLDLAQRELAQLEEQDLSFMESSEISVRNFFRERGRYLVIAVAAFFTILLVCRIMYRIIGALFRKMNGKRKQRSFNMRLLDLSFRAFSVVLAIGGLFFVLYLGEDWFLLSMTIIFFLGLAWTVRQGAPILWQQMRLMLNIGAVRENERLIYKGVPWRVKSLNVFSELENPTLNIVLRVPIEELIGLASRAYHPEEPWFPCRKGDWVVVGSKSRAKVISLSHELVEVVERGGSRITYTTEAFIGACPTNLSRNFRLRVPFGLSYSVQDHITDAIPATLKAYIEQRLEEDGYDEVCLNLNVEFYQANASSLDLLVIADFEGKVADIQRRLDRALQKYCVECSTANNWEIPFPQLTVHTEPGEAV